MKHVVMLLDDNGLKMFLENFKAGQAVVLSTTEPVESDESNDPEVNALVKEYYEAKGMEAQAEKVNPFAERAKEEVECVTRILEDNLGAPMKAVEIADILAEHYGITWPRDQAAGRMAKMMKYEPRIVKPSYGKYSIVDEVQDNE